MKSNNYLLPHQLQIKIQGEVGEMVALGYSLEQLDTEIGDEVIIVTNRSEKLQFKYKRKGAVFRKRNETAYEFFQHELVDYYLRIGCNGIDLESAGPEAKNLFEKYMSKTKDQILSELKTQFENYLENRENNLSILMDFHKQEKKEKERQIEETSLTAGNRKKEYEVVLKAVSNLSHKELAKILALIDINRRGYIKNLSEIESSIRPYSIVDSIIICMQLFNLPTLSNKIVSRYEESSLLKTISKYVNAKYSELEILSSVFRGIVETRVIIDLMVAHLSSTKTLKKIIILECKTGDSVLSENQKAFGDYIHRLEFDKIEYKVINVDYKAPKEITVCEDVY